MALNMPEALDDGVSVPQKLSSWLARIHPWAPWLAALLAGLAAVMLAWQLMAGLFAHKPKAPPAPPVKVARAVRRDVAVMQKTIGTVVSPQTVQVTAQVTGKLLSAAFQEGQMVNKGDLLFQIDPAPYQAALAQVEGQLAKDAATLANARVDLSRYQTLTQQNAISNQQLVTQAATVKSDEGVVIADQANVQAARINLGYTRITSPVNGKTGAIFIQPGNVIANSNAGSTANPLVTITQMQPMKVSFMLPQNLLAQIQNQQAAGRLVAMVPMPGAAGDSEKAPVDFVSNIVSAATGTIELRADFSNTDMRLVPGQTVTVSVALANLAGATLVPRDAVNVGPDSSFVYVVDKDGKAQSRTVKVLSDDGTNDAVQGDVKPGDTVITDGQLRVVPGQAVRITKGNAAPKQDDTP
ncbi:MAG TPA: efflux RND transporter periplasmic adaptor subunit [Rhizomicrobium sp.]|nr:efflux RND transporter periplasmic adaptor subunit [Rhizomicrobium sp.]